MAELRAAARAPVHAYLLVGPPGSGKRAAARSFAACLLCPQGGCGQCRHCRLAVAGTHPDLVVLERSGAFIGVDEARDVALVAARSPLEAARQVLVLADFHLVDRAAPALLKTVEEPPATTVFVVLADHLVPELVTIASRCVTVELRPLTPGQLAAALEAEGVGPEPAARAAQASGGRLDRARLLASDPGLAARHLAWAGVPGRLDGTGATVVALVDELLAATEAALGSLRAAHQEELDARARSAQRRGERGQPGRREVEDRHRRELRRARTDELRSGLATLATAYRDRLAGGGAWSPAAGPGRPADPVRQASSRRPRAPSGAARQAVAAIDAAGRGLAHNPNEALLVQSLFLRLSSLVERGSALGAGRSQPA